MATLSKYQNFCSVSLLRKYFFLCHRVDKTTQIFWIIILNTSFSLSIVYINLKRWSFYYHDKKKKRGRHEFKQIRIDFLDFRMFSTDSLNFNGNINPLNLTVRSSINYIK